jgi:GNAT superfamily N-acetyltransferase
MTPTARITDTRVMPETAPLPDPAKAPAIAGLRARFFRDADDYAPMAEVIAAGMIADGVPYAPTAKNLQIDMETNEGSNRFDDVVVAEIDGRLIARSTVERMVRDDMPMYKVEGEVHPDYRRRGIGTWLFDWSVERSRARAAIEDPDVHVKLTSWTEDSSLGNVALLTRAGFAPVRYFYLMRFPTRRCPTASRSGPSRTTIDAPSSKPRTRPSATTGAIAR